MPDFSSYFRVHNKLGVPLIQKSQNVYSGSWQVWPADKIDGYTKSDWFQLKDNYGSFGSDGEVQYEARIDGVAHRIQFKVKCPFSDPNYAAVWILSSEHNPPLVTVTSVPREGNPTRAEFVVMSRDY